MNQRKIERLCEMASGVSFENDDDGTPVALVCLTFDGKEFGTVKSWYEHSNDPSIIRERMDDALCSDPTYIKLLDLPSTRPNITKRYEYAEAFKARWMKRDLAQRSAWADCAKRKAAR